MYTNSELTQTRMLAFVPAGHDDDDDEDEYEHNEQNNNNNCMCKKRRNGRNKRAYGGGCECPKSGVCSQGPIMFGNMSMPMGWKCTCNNRNERPAKVSVICSK
jgi:hypothetical protein